jgi:hypothetical protein
LRYIVTCQNAAGSRVEVSVTADTDEKACTEALRTLNTWKALLVLPKTHTIPTVPIETASLDDTPEHAADTRPRPGRLIHRPSITELIHQHRGRRGNLGDALTRASSSQW